MPSTMDAYDRLQVIARNASMYFLWGAFVVFVVGMVLVAIVLFRAGDTFGTGQDTPLWWYAQIGLTLGSTVIVPSTLLAAAGVAVRLYAESQVVRERRHEDLLETMSGRPNGTDATDGD
jgi:hypothetical protein